MSRALITFNQLSVSFAADKNRVRAVQDVSFTIRAGQTVGVVGESGCGKSVTAMSLMDLLPPQAARIDGGEILFEGQDLLRLKNARMADLRGNQLAMIFQEPMSALNPVLTVGEQLCEPLIRHRGEPPKAAWQHATQRLTDVGLARAESLMASYPHQLSGGMLQRVMIAMALSCQPKLLIADEPTTAPTSPCRRRSCACCATSAGQPDGDDADYPRSRGYRADGRARCGDVRRAYRRAGRDRRDSASPAASLYSGADCLAAGAGGAAPTPLFNPRPVPDLAALPAGCAFAERCTKATARCRQSIPPLSGQDRQAACFYSELSEAVT